MRHPILFDRQHICVFHLLQREELARLMNNLGGHDLPSIIEAFDKIDHDRPTCFIAYTAWSPDRNKTRRTPHGVTFRELKIRPYCTL
jgi:pyruvate dehydrogenase complex dehydrogenase (E1) component